MNSPVQKLESRLKEDLRPAERIDLLNEMSKSVRKTDLNLSLKLCEEARELALASDYQAGIVYSYLNQGRCYAMQGKFDRALDVLSDSLGICEKMNDLDLKGQTQQEIGLVYSDLDENKSALNFYFDALDSFVEVKDLSRKAAILSEIGYVYNQLGNYPNALEYFLKSMQTSFEFGDEVNYATLNRIGCVYVNLEDYATALDYYNRVLKITQNDKDKTIYGAALSNVGVIFNLMKNYSSALNYFYQYLEITRELGQRQYEAYTLTNLSDTYMNMKEYEKAFELENQVLPICEELFDNNLKTKTLMMIGDIYAQKNEFDLAGKYYHVGLELAQKANYEAYQTEILQNIGLLHLNKGDKSDAMEYLHAALEHAQRRNARKDLVKIHNILHTEHKKEGNILKAYEHLERMSSIEKELSGLESEKKLRSLSIQHEIQSAEKEKKMALQEEELFRLKNIELAKLNEELKDLNDEKSEILNITAHDLKNPLSGISSLSKRMHENADKMSGEEISRYSKQIEDVSHRMFELVTKILDINAIESGKRNMNPELFDPSMIMGVAMFDNRPHALAKNIEIVYKQESLPKVVLDKTSVRQILDNLISNAVKFSPSGKKIILSTQLLDGKVIYEIKDEGPGLTKEDKKKLFGKFARLSALPTGDENSTGLGLSITKRLTEAMNGKIWCESEEGEGAKFVVELPVNTN